MPTTEGEADALNAQQRRAVDHDGGPLVVLAGPGTGKTRVITHRIERMIRGGVRPEEIVALTFTVKAAEQLRRKLAGLVGPGAADRIHAHTFHGFGLRLIRRFPDYLGLGGEPTLIDSAQVRRLLRGLIREHDLFPDLVPSGRDLVIDEVSATISELANHALFPEDAKRLAAAWAKRLEDNPDKLDADGLAAGRLRQARFAESARAYRLYAAECTRRGWMTLDDLILWPIRLLREREAAAVICRDEYRHVVVDEFQDVNAAQIELLRLLCPPGSRRGAGPDLCVVGDDDQSIYEFRGADDRAFHRFEKTWGCEPAGRVPLTENYRSQRPIITVANAIMSRASHRFAPDKVVELPVSDRDKIPAEGACVECVTLDDDYQTGEVIAAMILADRLKAPERPWSSFAVIARGHLDLDRIGSALQMEGIPVRRSRGQSALDDRGVKDVLRWIDFLVHPAGDPSSIYAVQWLLTRPPCWLAPDRVNDWVQAYKAQAARGKIEAAASPPGFLEWLAERHGTDPGAGAAIGRLVSLAADLRRVAAQSAADEAVFEIIRRADIAHAELLPARERARRIGHLAEMIRFTRGRVDALDAPGDLAAFWSYYHDLSEDEQAFSSGIAADRVDGPSEPGEDGEDAPPPAVTLLTAHAAKGLEFDTVFVPRVRSPHGYPTSRGDDGEGIPDVLLDRLGDERPVKERRAAEERRLFYVAATRAQRRLVLLAHRRRNRTPNIDYFNEISMDEPCRGIVSVLDAPALLDSVSLLGVRLSTRTPLDDASSGLWPADSAEARRAILDAARRRARLAAARALDTADRPDATPEDLAAAQAALKAAAEEIAVAAYVDRHAAAPGWATSGENPPLARYALRLVEQARTGRDDGDLAAAVFRPLKGPLKLSYTWIEEYQRCPRCFYLRRIMRVPEPAGRPQIVGKVVHSALAAFYQRLRSSDASGGAAPGLDALLAAGREEFLRAAGTRSPADAEQLGQVLGQLRLMHQKLFDPRAEVEQVEFSIYFPYPHTLPGEHGEGAQTVHTFEAKMDRLDRLPGGATGHRIVDYKTGGARKALLEPGADDLQLGIYAMALSHHQGGEAESLWGRGLVSAGRGGDEAALLAPATGVAEYWVLSTGQRGSIDLADIDYAEVKEQIDTVVTGLLKGPFKRGDPKRGGCWGLCEMFLGA